MEAESIAALATGITAIVTVIGNQIANGRAARIRREEKEAERERRQLEHEQKIDSSIQKAHESAVGAMLAAATQTQEVFKGTLDRVNHLFDREQASHAECRREVHEVRRELATERAARRDLERRLAPFLRSITPQDFPAAPSDTPPDPSDKKFPRPPMKPPIPR
jgi:crotonobetainyl-CoA:carnitine CoA-transferase CaiB-like acyl-CoA transferase